MRSDSAPITAAHKAAASDARPAIGSSRWRCRGGQDAHRIAADAEEHGVAEAHHPAIAQDHVEADGSDRPDDDACADRQQVALVDAIATGQLQATGTLQDIGEVAPGGRAVAIIDITDDTSSYNLPGGSSAQVALYTEYAHHFAIIRRILLRMRSWQNFVFLEGHGGGEGRPLGRGPSTLPIGLPGLARDLGGQSRGSAYPSTPPSRNVRFTPDSGHSSVQVGCPLSASKRTFIAPSRCR